MSAMAQTATLDEMFPRAEVVTRAPLPKLKTPATYQLIQHNAQTYHLDLTDDHREVIDFVLDFYEHCDDCENARQLADLLDAEFALEGGRKYLYQLFPSGPLSTIHELANLPPLSNETDPSFGTRF